MIGLNGSTIMHCSLEESLRAARFAGFAAYEFRTQHIDAYLQTHSLEELEQLVRDAGVQPLSINAIEQFNTEDDVAFGRVMELTTRFSAIADRIGCPYIIFVPQPERDDWNAVLQRTVNRLRQIAHSLQGHRVKPLLEFIGFPEFPLRTLDRSLEVVRATPDLDLGIVLDTFHHAIGKSQPTQFSADEVERIRLVHLDDVEDVVGVLTDGNRVLPGQGRGNLSAVAASLHQLGYRGAYSVELFRQDYWTMAPTTVAHMAYEAARTVLASVSL